MIWPWSPIQEQINEFFPPDAHPYMLFERAVEREMQPAFTVLDVGCGNTAPLLRAFRGKVGKLIGIDVTEFPNKLEGIELVRCDVARIPLKNNTVDLAYSRALMEHIEHIENAYQEVFRVLKSGGRYVFATPSIYDYASVMASMVPNRWHPAIVRFAEGRDESKVFPTYYRSNSKRRVMQLAANTGFAVEKISYVGQYPNYFSFSRPLFYVGCLYAKTLQKLPALGFLQGWLFCVLRKP